MVQATTSGALVEAAALIDQTNTTSKTGLKDYIHTSFEIST